MGAQPETHVLLFGSQTLFPKQESFSELRETLIQNSAFKWILDVISELQGPSGKTAADAFPHLDLVPGVKLLDEWVKSGQLATPLPNSALTPLVVIGHLVQYIQYKELSKAESAAAAIETIGLCTGLLSAFAISSSSDDAQIQQYGSTAIRLAVLVGSAVDAQNGAEGELVSLSAGWTSSDGESVVKSILSHFPEAYISVNYDERRYTVTTPVKHVAALTEQLKAARVIVSEIGLFGPFHSQAHADKVESYIKFAESNPSFQLPDASKLQIPTHSNDDGEQIKQGKLHEIAIRSMLVNTSNWYESVSKVLSTSLANPNSKAVVFGAEKVVSPSLVRKLGSRLSYVADYDERILRLTPNDKPNVPDNRIAVIGMGANVAGAADLDEYWDIIREGKSQHVEVPKERIQLNTIFRESDKNKKWYGNFIKDQDVFDHKFFKKSPREMAYADPQHRLLLQTVYQAVAQSGYFTSLPRHPEGEDLNISVYLGLSLNDYNDNVSCYPANAYSATGNLKSFAAGRISHHFGWTGPSMTIDTACSSSAVAVHQACVSLLTGESTMAVASGVNVITSADWWHNLNGASFLSPTGQCKPFDIKGDGYCRGEAVAAVLLKKYSDAVADGNQILGVVASTAVTQNRNCTAITVPNSPSLGNMFRDVTRKAGLDPKQISYVEAHGTGTPVGDPAEYGGVRQVFGGSQRSDVLSLGSVKGLIGHCETASGLASLVKVLLMLHHGYIPPQASHDTINPSLQWSADDKIEVTTKVKPWDAKFRATLINNYGASGNNSCMIVTQAPTKGKSLTEAPIHQLTTKHPFWLSAFDDKSLASYVSKLLTWVRSNKVKSLANLAFQVALQGNRTLPRAFVFEASSVEELEQTLAAFPNGGGKLAPFTPPAPRPVILAFGGQISTSVGLDKEVYESSALLRKYLDQVDEAASALRQGGSIYPGIFQKEPVADVSDLQTQLFALEYSIAKTWIETGVNVAAVVGHSFGELVSLAVSGILSLNDALRLVLGRARVIKESWGADKGAMIAVEADLDVVQELLATANEGISAPEATIACYNGPRSFTLGGSVEAIDRVEAARAKESKFSTLKAKRLNVTNAFHSTLVEPLLDQLTEVGKTLTFKNPTIHFERVTENAHTGRLTASYVAEQLRKPVYFNQAVQRLAKQHPDAIWLEAGSNSTITVMASRALGNPSGSHFQALSINAGNGLRTLTDGFVNLWREGLNISFWPHHHIQTSEYTPLLLPPYQFEKSRHWVEIKEPPKPVEVAPTVIEKTVGPKQLWDFVGFRDEQQRSAVFELNMDSEEFISHVTGHKLAGSVAICPSILHINIVTAALISLFPNFQDAKYQPTLKNMVSHSPMMIDLSKQSWVYADAVDADRLVWDFTIVTQEAGNPSAPTTLHFTLRATLRSVEDEDFVGDFEKYERLVGAKRPRNFLNGKVDVDEVIQGRNIYRSFADIVDYNDKFRGMKKIVGKDGESAARVVWPYNLDYWLNTGLADSFLQTGGIYVNCMTDHSEKEIFISDRIDQWIRSPKLLPSTPRPDAWDVYACNHQASQKEYLCDIFAFNADTGELGEVILGLRFQKVTRAGLIRVLGGAVPPAAASAPKPASAPSTVPNGIRIPLPSAPAARPAAAGAPAASPAPAAPKKEKKSSGPSVDVVKITTEILMNLSGLEPSDIKDDSELAELGIDSLMGMELCREIEGNFKISYDSDLLNDISDFKGLIISIQKIVGPDAAGGGDDEGEEEPEATTNGHSEAAPTPTSNGVNGTNGVNGVHSATNGAASSFDGGEGAKAILDVFRELKKKTDDYLAEGGVADYYQNVEGLSNKQVIIYTINALEKLGCPIRDAKAGTKLPRIEHLPKHKRQVDRFYRWLQKHELVEINGDNVIRTDVAAPTEDVDALTEELIKKFPLHQSDFRLTRQIGSRLAECLVGKEEGVQLIFSSPEGRKYATDLYAESPTQAAPMGHMFQIINDVAKRLYKETGEPVKILELGAGTGGTTVNLLSTLSALDIPIEYTVSDLSSSLVAGLRKRFKDYPYMKFKIIDVEKEPTGDLSHTQHLVIATNCIHATRDLRLSTKNIHSMLHPAGALLLLELVEPPDFFDLIFGMVEGWWLFDDGRGHACAQPQWWSKVMKGVGYGEVDWSDGARPENKIQRLILATASSASRYDGPTHPLLSEKYWTDLPAREAAIDSYVEQFSEGFSLVKSPEVAINSPVSSEDGSYVLLTGATGSLGGQMAAYFARRGDVNKVFCLNRSSRVDPAQRQKESMENRGVFVDEATLSKLKIFETDTSKPLLGLSDADYEFLVGKVTHVIHNAWPMSLTRDIHTFKAQFRVMRNMINFIRDIAAVRPGPKVSIEFISSIAVIGYRPLHQGHPLVPEDPMDAQSVLPTGYGDAKLVCERMLAATLGQHPHLFRAMSTRVGQICGSHDSGYWNPTEHFAFIVKSSQTLQALPELPGNLSWCPANDVATAIGELVLADNTPYATYHVENPSRQPWSEMVPILAEALGLPQGNIIPFDDWIARVKAYPGPVDTENPARKLIDFLDLHFHRMGCGGLVMDTTHSRQHSKTLAEEPPVDAALVHKIVTAWKDMGYLRP